MNLNPCGLFSRDLPRASQPAQQYSGETLRQMRRVHGNNALVRHCLNHIATVAAVRLKERRRLVASKRLASRLLLK